ncbi:hypothetical protein BJ508DRAFT_324734 [Ascobolus immersus RN42]|uniref:Uncharacterized protein n=1 Tax=Ascobolus immersus RN42 TaxID=1160509 RepID=A0A3N4IG81_ASCIM|nr:hypothetical protein BJ508DRAFT_324734 [Ascobolus immersus RN42]
MAKVWWFNADPSPNFGHDPCRHLRVRPAGFGEDPPLFFPDDDVENNCPLKCQKDAIAKASTSSYRMSTITRTMNVLRVDTSAKAHWLQADGRGSTTSNTFSKSNLRQMDNGTTLHIMLQKHCIGRLGPPYAGLGLTLPDPGRPKTCIRPGPSLQAGLSVRPGWPSRPVAYTAKFQTHSAFKAYFSLSLNNKSSLPTGKPSIRCYELFIRLSDFADSSRIASAKQSDFPQLTFRFIQIGAPSITMPVGSTISQPNGDVPKKDGIIRHTYILDLYKAVRYGCRRWTEPIGTSTGPRLKEHKIHASGVVMKLGEIVEILFSLGVDERDSLLAFIKCEEGRKGHTLQLSYIAAKREERHTSADMLLFELVSN